MFSHSKYDSEEGKDSDEEIKKTSIETKSINNKPSIQLISNIPLTKRILLTTQRTLAYKFSCGHTKRIKYTLEKIYTTNKKIRRDAISKIKENKETRFQCGRLEDLQSVSKIKALQRKPDKEDTTKWSPKSRQSSRLPTYLSRKRTPIIEMKRK